MEQVFNDVFYDINEAPGDPAMLTAYVALVDDWWRPF
jgi:hypothetical protein